MGDASSFLLALRSEIPTMEAQMNSSPGAKNIGVGSRGESGLWAAETSLVARVVPLMSYEQSHHTKVHPLHPPKFSPVGLQDLKSEMTPWTAQDPFDL